MNLKNVIGVPTLPDHYFYRVEVKGAPHLLRVQVREDYGPSWWPNRYSRAVASQMVDLSKWYDAEAAIVDAARRCVFVKGFGGRKRAWLVRYEATAFLGDHR